MNIERNIHRADANGRPNVVFLMDIYARRSDILRLPGWLAHRHHDADIPHRASQRKRATSIRGIGQCVRVAGARLPRTSLFHVGARCGREVPRRALRRCGMDGSVDHHGPRPGDILLHDANACGRDDASVSSRSGDGWRGRRAPSHMGSVSSQMARQGRRNADVE